MSMKFGRERMAQITGFNHVVLLTNDMDQTVRFYRDLLGLKVKATVGGEDRTLRRFYLFELGNGDCLGFFEFPGEDTAADASTLPQFWPDAGKTAGAPRKLDHLALNVENLAALLEVQERLRARGVVVSEVLEVPGPICVKSIYFYDPNGIPLEIATWDLDDPKWQERGPDAFFGDTDPVAALSE